MLEGETERVGGRNGENVSMSSVHSDGTNTQELSATLTYIPPPHAIVSVVTDARVTRTRRSSCFTLAPFHVR